VRRGTCSGVWGRGAGGRDVVDSSGLIPAMTSAEGTMTMGVASGPDSGGAEETDGMSCGGDVVGRAALIGNFARERL
jgi:hypothetical protein